jgi:hypothetical protein
MVSVDKRIFFGPGEVLLHYIYLTGRLQPGKAQKKKLIALFPDPEQCQLINQRLPDPFIKFKFFYPIGGGWQRYMRKNMGRKICKLKVGF